jgi:hypothetical protein
VNIKIAISALLAFRFLSSYINANIVAILAPNIGKKAIFPGANIVMAMNHMIESSQ